MRKRLEREVREWLDAERLSKDTLAEQSLSRAFAEIERRSPGPGFADRVMLASGLGRAAAFWRSRWLRAAIAVGMVAAGLAVVALPAVWLVADPLARALGSPLALTISHGVTRTMARTFAVWSVLDDVASALRASLDTGPVLALLAANALMAATSLFGLKRLLKAPEELIS